MMSLLGNPAFLKTLDERVEKSDELAKRVADQIKEIKKRQPGSVHYRPLCENLSEPLEAYLEAHNESAKTYHPEVKLLAPF